MTNETVGGLHWVDGGIIIAYLLLLTGIGVYFSRKQKTFDEFVRGGSGVGWMALGFSLMAALNSGLDYVQVPAAVYGIGLVFITSSLAWIPLYPWITRVTLPFYRRLNVYSAYEYLEMRFGLAVRLVAAGIFILWRVGWMGAAIYVPCLAVNAATGGEMSIQLMVVVLGVVVTFYTMLGGMRAVVWTDVVQFVIMFGGLAVTLWLVLDMVPGGVAEIHHVAVETGRIALTGPEITGATGFWEHIGAFLTTEVTMTGVFFTVMLSIATKFTADQVAVQRLQSSRSLKEARRSFIVNALADSLWIVVLAGVGLALLAYFAHNPPPEGLPNDRVLPQFMREHFPTGLIGLVIAAIFAASLSSVDAALNSCSSIIVIDFYNRFWCGRTASLADITPSEASKQVLIGRMATLSLGLLMVAIGINVERLGEIYAAANRILGAFFGPLFGIFILGMFTRGAHSAGVIVGALAGLFGSCFVSFFSATSWLQTVCGYFFGDAFVQFFSHLSWVWPSPIGILVTLIVGGLASLLLPSTHDRSKALTFAVVMQGPDPETEKAVVSLPR